MAEDQGVDGDRWNDQATILLRALGWESLGDSNMDISNEDDKNHGVDRLFKFVDSKTGSIHEGVIVEAKTYRTINLSSKMLENWIKTLDRKLSNIKNAAGFYDQFPMMDGNFLRTGLIVIWFHDLKEYSDFRTKFWKYASEVQLPRRNNSQPNKIYVLDNDAVLRLASLCVSIVSINRQEEVDRNVQFFYPSVDVNVAKRSSVLNLNYMFSKFILGDFINKNGIENRLVFYFGSLTIKSFQRLQRALSMYGYLDHDKPLTIYTYQRSANFRKIEPDIINLFTDLMVQIEEMENFVDLPIFMRKK
jgi:hypothetical protein